MRNSENALGGRPITKRGRMCLEILRVLHGAAENVGREVCGDAFFPSVINDPNTRTSFIKKWVSLMMGISPDAIEVPPKPKSFSQGFEEWCWFFALELNTPENYFVPDPVSFFDGHHRVINIPRETGDKILALKGIPNQ